MDEKVVRVNRSGGSIVIELTFGQAQFGKYQIYLYDSQGNNPKLIGGGLSTDQQPDVFEIPKPGSLDQYMLGWQGFITAYSTQEGQRYSLSVTIQQDGQPLEIQGPSPNQSGPLSGTKVFADYVRITL